MLSLINEIDATHERADEELLFFGLHKIDFEL